MFSIDKPSDIIILCIITAFSTQLFKYLVMGFMTGLWSGESFRTTGGMPSSHSALVTCLVCSVAFLEGINSTEFLISLTFGIVVIHDAFGVRFEAGKHAKLLNKLKENLDVDFLDPAEKKILKEKLGHRPIEVVVGVLYGIIIATLGSWFI